MYREIRSYANSIWDDNNNNNNIVKMRVYVYLSGSLMWKACSLWAYCSNGLLSTYRPLYSNTGHYA